MGLHTGRVHGDFCLGIPAHTPERLWLSSSEIERLINAPSDCFGIKNKHTEQRQRQKTVCVACTQASLSAQKTLNVISTQPPVYVKGVDKHHMNSNKAHPPSTNTSSSRSCSVVHCNLNPLFENCVCMHVCGSVCLMRIKTNKKLQFWTPWVQHMFKVMKTRILTDQSSVY